MTSSTRTLFLGLDAFDLDVAQDMAARGQLPNIAKLLESSAAVETLAEPGFFVSSLWATLFTGLSASRHGYVSWDEIAGGAYEYRETHPDSIAGTPFWEVLSDAGQRVAVLDVPHARLARGLNGVQLVEWGAHDRHRATASWPASYLEEITDRFGENPVGSFVAGGAQWAPCDYMHRTSAVRDDAQNAALLAGLREGIARKRAFSVDLLERGDWDLFCNVLGESHCVGHQFWHVHDPTAKRHDAEVARRLGGDPLALIYRDLDESVGAHVAAAGPDTSVYVLFSHGMRAHNDGTQLLDPVLWRLDEYASGATEAGPFTRSADRIAGALPPELRHRTLSALARARHRVASRFPYEEFDDELPDRGERRWWAQPNNSVSGSVRLNMYGRERDGRILERRSRDVACWLADRLRDLVNLDTGEHVVERIIRTDDYYDRFEGDAFGDLIVEWNRSSPIERVWSAATGVVYVPYTHWRTGDHDRRGLLLVRAPGVEPGPRSEPLATFQVAPTLAASLGIELPDVDGAPAWDLVAAEQRATAAVVAVNPGSESEAGSSRRRRWSARYELPAVVGLHRTLVGLQHAHHVTRMGLDDLERLASIATTSAWLRHVDVPESMLVSVVTPTRNRSEHLARAIASVQAQQYQRWELLIVDDGSEDDTASLLSKAAASDERIRPYRIDHAGVSAARNYALDHAAGDVIVYLDDDNRFDPDWLHSVVWAFTDDAQRQVVYGARLVDDHGRLHGGDPSSRPWVHFAHWDPVAIEDANRVDMNVLAHRPSTARFDTRVAYYADWDLLLQLTDDTDPFDLPVVATYYTTDAENRLTEIDTKVIDLEYEHIRDKTAQRRALNRLGPEVK